MPADTVNLCLHVYKSRLRRPAAFRARHSLYERVLVRAHSRVPSGENHNLAERVRRASVAGIAIQSPTVDYALEPSLLAEHTHGLQDEIVEAVGRRAQRFTDITGRPWRLGDIRFSLRDDWNEEYSPKRVGRKSAMASY